MAKKIPNYCGPLSKAVSDRIDHQTDVLNDLCRELGDRYSDIEYGHGGWRIVDRESMEDGWAVTYSDALLAPTYKKAYRTLRMWARKAKQWEKFDVSQE